MGIDIQFEHFSKVETFSLDELDNHFVKLYNFEMDEVPDVPLLDHLEIRDQTTAPATMLRLNMISLEYARYSNYSFEPKRAASIRS